MLDYLPARMINEFVYCPRLFYLIHVEGQFADSIDTIGGRIVHRRVDTGNGGLPPAAEQSESFIPAADRDGALLSDFDQPPRRRQRPKHIQPATLFGTDESGSDEPEPDSEAAAKDGAAKDLDTKAAADTPPSSQLALDDTEPPPRTIHARSVTLSSDSLGVIAKLDLVEALGNQATPVDYKRGRPKRNADGTLSAWDPERVQIALQVLLLRDNGYDCHGGILYFNETRQRVDVPVDDELIAQTRQAVSEARRLRDCGKIPPPLVASPKCPRCSLVNICLPEETRRLAAAATPARLDCGDQNVGPVQPGDSSADAEPSAASNQPDSTDVETATVRPIITPRDDRRPVYFNTQGMLIRRQGEVLRAKVDGKVVQEIRLNEVNQINLFGNIQLSTQAIQTMLGREIPVVYFTQRGYFYGMSAGLGVKNILTRQQQFRSADDSEFCLALARRLVEGKIRNQRTLLMRNHTAPSVESLRELKRCAARALKADSLASLLGIEGNAARIYFADFAGMLKVNCDLETAPGGALSETRPAFDFRGRNRRPPRDPVNALLSLAYSLLTKDCMIAAAATGLDPHLGFFHQIKPGKPALALDMMEPFRPLIADSVVLSAINNRMVTPEHFIVAGQSVVLGDSGRKQFLYAYEQRMDQLVTHPLFGYRVSYRRLLEIQTRLLSRLLTGEIAEYPVFQTR